MSRENAVRSEFLIQTRFLELPHLFVGRERNAYMILTPVVAAAPLCIGADCLAELVECSHIKSNG